MALRVVCSMATPRGALGYIRTFRKGITTTTHLPFRVPLELRFHNHTAPMHPDKFRGFDVNDPTWSNDASDDDIKPDLNSLNSNVAGPSRPRTGGDVRGNLNSYPSFFVSSTTPTPRYPGRGSAPNEGKPCRRPW